MSGLQWIVDGYALALAALMLGGGAVGDLHGHKRVVLTGLAVFGLASIGCGLAVVGRDVGVGDALVDQQHQPPGSTGAVASTLPDEAADPHADVRTI